MVRQFLSKGQSEKTEVPEAKKEAAEPVELNAPVVNEDIKFEEEEEEEKEEEKKEEEEEKHAEEEEKPAEEEKSD